MQIGAVGEAASEHVTAHSPSGARAPLSPISGREAWSTWPFSWHFYDYIPNHWADSRSRANIPELELHETGRSIRSDGALLNGNGHITIPARDKRALS